MRTTDPQHVRENCLALFERLSEYIDRELDVHTHRHIESHIESCAPCRVCLETLKQSVDLCKRLEKKHVPHALALKLKTTIIDMVNKGPD